MIKYETVKVIDVHDWDKLVTDTYKRPYMLQQQDGCMERQRIHITVPPEEGWEDDKDMPESIPEVVNGEEMGVKFSAWRNRDPKQKAPGMDRDWEVELFWQRNFYPLLSAVTQDLYEKGLLDQGEYEIDIDW